MILDAPPSDWKRPNMPKRVKDQVRARQGNVCVQTGEDLEGQKVQYDHRPPVSERKFDTGAWDTIPPANDPEHIDALTARGHDIRTNGPRGEKRITTAGSDSHRRAKLNRFRGETKQRPKAKIAGRPLRSGRKFPKRLKA